MSRVFDFVQENGRKYVVADYRGNKVLRLDDAQAVQSFGTSGPTGLYYDDMVSAVPPGAESILILGLGCGTVARRLRETGHKKAIIIGVDNDPVMLELGIKHFDLNEYVDTVFKQDARTFHTFCSLRFDAVLVDVYRDNFLKIDLPYVHELVMPGGVLIDYDLKHGVTKIIF